MDEIDKTGEPILLRRGNRIEAALVPIALFRERFVDVMSTDELVELRARVRARRVKAKANAQDSSLEILRRLRGYEHDA